MSYVKFEEKVNPKIRRNRLIRMILKTIPEPGSLGYNTGTNQLVTIVQGSKLA
jgi:hypothetical protein